MRIVKNKHLTDEQIEFIETRFVHQVKQFETQYLLMSVCYTLMSIFIMVSGVLITTFLTFDKVAEFGPTAANTFYWINLSLSFSIVIVNRLMSIFALKDRKMIVKESLENLYANAWSFASGINKYSGSDAYDRFIIKVESIIGKNYKMVKNLNKSPNEKMEASVAVNKADDSVFIKQENYKLKEVIVSNNSPKGGGGERNDSLVAPIDPAMKSAIIKNNIAAMDRKLSGGEVKQ